MADVNEGNTSGDEEAVRWIPVPAEEIKPRSNKRSGNKAKNRKADVQYFAPQPVDVEAMNATLLQQLCVYMRHSVL